MIVLEDALRADHLSLYGYKDKTSPFKEELLQSQGAVFMRARSQDNVTRTSLPSMMTSLLPSVTGVWGFADMLRPEFLTLAEVLRQQGFATGSFVQNSNAGPASGLQQGFESPPTTPCAERPRHCWKASSYGTGCAPTRTATPSPICTSSIRMVRTTRRPPYDEDYRKMTDDGKEAASSATPRSTRQYVKTPTAASRAALYDGEIRHNDEKLRNFFDRMKAEGLFDDTLVRLHRRSRRVLRRARCTSPITRPATCRSPACR